MMSTKENDASNITKSVVNNYLSIHLSHPNHLNMAVFRWFFILSIS